MVLRSRMIAGVAIISFSAIFVRLADVSPVTAAFFRTAYALPVLFALRMVMPTSQVRTRTQRLLAFGAGLAFAGDLVAWHIAIELIGAGLSTVVGSIHVVTTMLAGWVVLSQRPTRLAVLATPVVLIGVVLIAGVGSGDAQGEDP
ncbi:EamA family transporter, partial [Actinomycetota bacterium]